MRPQAREEIHPQAVAMWPALEGAEPIAAYAGLRPAGRGVNYLIEPSRACAGLVNVAAIRSTGLTASLGIAEYVCGLVAAARRDTPARATARARRDRRRPRCRGGAGPRSTASR